MADARTFVIVGGGLAGAKAAQTLREEGFEGRVVLIGDEDALPYERPPLSKGYFTGASTLAEATVHPAGFYAENAIDLRLAEAVTALDVHARRVQLGGGESLTYDALLLATGAAPRRLPVGGPDARVLRTVADADALRALVTDGGRLAIVGAGWIGCELAASARTLGAHVTLYEYASVPLERVLGARLGSFFADLHRSEGVELITDARVDRVEGYDAVVLAVGVAPRVELAERAGLAVADGIVTDELLATSAPGVFAAGDVASALHPLYGRHVRVEHWGNALEQGAAAARSMLGRGRPYEHLPYFFSDQYDIGLEYWGLHEAQDRLEIDGDPGERRFQAFWRDDAGRVSAGMHVNDWDAAAAVEQRVREGARAAPAR